MKTKCVGICEADFKKKICKGCYRTFLEIEKWKQLSEEEQKKVLTGELVLIE